nr:hypothetical protein CFP56_40629 [Quercus suber]
MSSPFIFEAGESSFRGPRPLETSYQTGFSKPSSGGSENIATKDVASSGSIPTTAEHLAKLPKVPLGTFSALVASEVRTAVNNAKLNLKIQCTHYMVVSSTWHGMEVAGKVGFSWIRGFWHFQGAGGTCCGGREGLGTLRNNRVDCVAQEECYANQL